MTTATAPQKSPNFVQRADALGRATGPNFALAHIGRPEDLMRYGVRLLTAVENGGAGEDRGG